VTPGGFNGSNSYIISPDGRHAFHSFSSFDDPGIRELITLPDHRVVTITDDHAALKQKLAPLANPPVEFFKRRPATTSPSTATC
jgi:dipeptidyl-peptidase 4